MAEITQPVVIELGRQKKKRIKQLRQGKGPLVDEVRATIDQTVAALGDAADGKTFVPIVMIYRQREKRGALRLLGL